jgi:aldose 1-epimerase
VITEVGLSAGRWEVIVLPEAGARLHALRYDGVDILRTPANSDVHLGDPRHWGSYVMAPWCNRLHRLTGNVFGRSLHLDADFAGPSCIHGQVSDSPWQNLSEGRFAVVAGGDVWPWRYSVTQQIRVTDNGVGLDLSLRNLDDGPMPAGIGIHPWYTGAVSVEVPAALVMNDNALPLAAFGPVIGGLDVRECKALPRYADATWSALSEPQLRVRAAHWSFNVIQTFSRTVSHVTMARSNDFEATAVEPQTHAPDGLERLLAGHEGGLAVLPPGDELAINCKWTVKPD